MSATDTRAVVQQLVKALDDASWNLDTARATINIVSIVDEALAVGRALLAALPEQPAAPQGDSVAGSGLPLDTVRTGDEAWEVERARAFLPAGWMLVPPVTPGQQWKCGDEFLPFHPQASHVPAEYRDGWNRCYAMAIHLGAVSVPAETASGARPQDEHAHPVIGVVLPSQSVRIGGEGWIPVSERLPMVWTEVMVWPQPTDQHMTAQLKSDGGWEYQEYVHHHGWDSVKMSAPTHWMPLPAPPSVRIGGDGANE